MKDHGEARRVAKVLVADCDDAQVAMSFLRFAGPRQLHENIVVIESIHLVENDDD